MCNCQIGGICHSVYLGDLQTHLQHKHNKGRSKALNALKQNMPSLLANQIPTVVCTPLFSNPSHLRFGGLGPFVWAFEVLTSASLPLSFSPSTCHDSY